MKSSNVYAYVLDVMIGCRAPERDNKSEKKFTLMYARSKQLQISKYGNCRPCDA
jgi:hypothetical protein